MGQGPLKGVKIVEMAGIGALPPSVAAVTDRDGDEMVEQRGEIDTRQQLGDRYRRRRRPRVHRRLSPYSLGFDPVA